MALRTNALDGTNAQQTVRELRREFRELVHRYPEAKTKAKEATNSDAWGPTSEQKLELVKIACNHSDDRELIYKALVKRLEGDTSYWMHSWKAMDVLEYFLFLEVPDILPRLHQLRPQLTKLNTYDKAVHEDPVRRSNLNQNVQNKATRLLRLLDDPEFFAVESQKVLTMMTRLSSSGASGPASTGSSFTPAAAAKLKGTSDIYKDDADNTGTRRSAEKSSFVESSSTAHRHVGLAAQGYQLASEATRPTMFAAPQQPATSAAAAGPAKTSDEGRVDLFSKPLHDAPVAAQASSIFGLPQSQQPPAAQPLPAHQPLPQPQPQSLPQSQPYYPPPPVPQSRGPQDTFDPFAEVNAAFGAEERRKAQSNATTTSSNTAADFFGSTVPFQQSHATVSSNHAASYSPPPPGPDHLGARSGAPPQGGQPGSDRMTDAMFSQLESLQLGRRTNPANKGDTQSLSAMLQGRPS